MEGIEVKKVVYTASNVAFVSSLPSKVASSRPKKGCVYSSDFTSKGRFYKNR